MGYRGKLAEQDEARKLRAQGWRLAEIAAELGVAKASVSVWVRGVVIAEPIAPGRSENRRPSSLHVAKLEEIAALRVAASQWLGELSQRDRFVAGVALYAGEGSKSDGKVVFTNTNAAMVVIYCEWLREFFEIDETRMRARLYLHDGLDLEAAVRHWTRLLAIPANQFQKPYRAAANPSLRHAKHDNGCIGVSYNCSATHRMIVGLTDALLQSPHLPG